MPKYHDVHVQLTGLDSNAMVLMAAVTRALRKAGAQKEEIDAFVTEATSGDYNNVIATCGRWVNIS